MSEESGVEEALTRLDKALDSFEVAAVRVTQASKAQSSLQGEVDALREDRARLAEELDAVKSQARRLGETNEQVAARLDGIMHNIRALLGGPSD